MSERPIDRLKQFVEWTKQNGYSKGESSFEKICGLSARYVANSLSLNKNGDITTSVISRIFNRFPMLNLVWLVTGKGEMINTCRESVVMDYKAAYEAAMRQIVALNHIIEISEYDTVKCQNMIP